jgi:hypothetical protein
MTNFEKITAKIIDIFIKNGNLHYLSLGPHKGGSRLQPSKRTNSTSKYEIS